ncbi:SRPBCC family protein [Actinoallomurus sp. CA-150999]|uniref:SRPBCC family protein n=1 Tax=Actinoallomurus sp. CA-150999 TaxID=3239887 RepID=UPI003D940F59
MTEATRSAREAARSATRPLEEATERLPGGELLKSLHTDRLLNEVQGLITAMATRALLRLISRVEGAADRLGDYSEHGGGGLLPALTGGAGGGLVSAVTKGGGGRLLSVLTGGGEGESLKDRLAPGFNALKAFARTKLEQKARGGKGGKGKKLKVTNIVETLDVGVPVRLAYDQWTRFEDFPSFTKKVEDVHQESDEKVRWKAHILWSHRDWESTIIEQVPDRRIVWRSKGPKGYVDGAVVFSEIGPDLTRIALVLEYHPKGFFEYTGNLWRAQGRRARLEFKHFQRHAMTQAILRPDEIEGWRGEIHDGQVVKDHETALHEEQEGRPAERAKYGADEEEPERAERRGREERYAEEEAEYEYDYEDEEPGEEFRRREAVSGGRGDRPDRARRERRG